MTAAQRRQEFWPPRRSGASRRAFIAALAATGLATLESAPLAQPPDGQDGFDDLFTPQARQAVDDGLAFLASRQNDDGSFGTGGYSRNVAVCSLCGMALLAAGNTPGRGRYGGALKRTVTFMLDHCQDSGFITNNEAASRGPMYGHGFATLFLAEVHGMALDPGLRDKLAAAVKLIVSTQNDEGGWRYQPRRDEADLSVTVCQVMALRAARNAGLYVPNETIDRAIKYVVQCQNPDGGFAYLLRERGESAFPRSAAALVALYSAGIYDSDEIRRGLAYLARIPPRPNPYGQQSYYFYGHYYAVQAMWHAGGAYWEKWYPAVRDVLLESQQKPQPNQDGRRAQPPEGRRMEGSWPDSISPEYGTAMACLVLQMPQNFLPIFQR